jgi:hypothetical protein
MNSRHAGGSVESPPDCACGIATTCRYSSLIEDLYARNVRGD